LGCNLWRVKKPIKPSLFLADYSADPAQLRAIEALGCLRQRVVEVQGKAIQCPEKADESPRHSTWRLHVLAGRAWQKLFDGLFF